MVYALPLCAQDLALHAIRPLVLFLLPTDTACKSEYAYIVPTLVNLTIQAIAEPPWNIEVEYPEDMSSQALCAGAVNFRSGALDCELAGNPNKGMRSRVHTRYALPKLVRLCGPLLVRPALTAACAHASDIWRYPGRDG